MSKQVIPVDWPAEEGNTDNNGECSITEHLSQNKFDLFINLPLRSHGGIRTATLVTHGYKTRRMAIDFSVPLITNIKCAKLFVEVTTSKVYLFVWNFISESFPPSQSNANYFKMVRAVF